MFAFLAPVLLLMKIPVVGPLLFLPVSTAATMECQIIIDVSPYGATSSKSY